MKTKLGQNIRAAREAKGLGRSSLGILLGVDGHTIYRWERGETVPRIPMLVQLAEALGTTAPKLLSKGGG